MKFQMHDAVIERVSCQTGVRWAKFTLEYPRFRNTSIWNRAMKDAFVILCRTYPSTSLKNSRKAQGLPILQHLSYMGGNLKDLSRVKTDFHAQGLIEVLDNDPVLIKLNKNLDSAWKHAVTQTKGMNRNTANPFELETTLREATIWTEPLLDSAVPYLCYLSRNEGNDLGFGVDKIVWDATSLPPQKTIRN